MSENEFAGIMAAKTDEQLKAIVTTERNDYQPLAIAAAEAELQKRHIDVSGFKEQAARETAPETGEKADPDELVFWTVDAGTRFLHYVIDTIAITIVFGLLVAVFVVVQALFSFLPSGKASQVITYALYGTAFFGYYVFMENKYQRTLGKFLTGAYVITTGGDKPSLGDIWRRTFCRLIPFDNISFFFSSGFHDYLSSTMVVKDEKED